jgi:hypothetical protein
MMEKTEAGQGHHRRIADDLRGSIGAIKNETQPAAPRMRRYDGANIKEPRLPAGAVGQGHRRNFPVVVIALVLGQHLVAEPDLHWVPHVVLFVLACAEQFGLIFRILRTYNSQQYSPYDKTFRSVGLSRQSIPRLVKFCLIE